MKLSNTGSPGSSGRPQRGHMAAGAEVSSKNEAKPVEDANNETKPEEDTNNEAKPEDDAKNEAELKVGQKEGGWVQFRFEGLTHKTI